MYLNRCGFKCIIKCLYIIGIKPENHQSTHHMAHNEDRLDLQNYIQDEGSHVTVESLKLLMLHANLKTEYYTILH